MLNYQRQGEFPRVTYIRSEYTMFKLYIVLFVYISTYTWYDLSILFTLPFLISRCVLSYPVLADGTTKEEYSLALDVLATNNCVTLNEWKKYRRKKKSNPSPGECEERVSMFDALDLDLECEDFNEELDISESDVARSFTYDIVDNTCESVFGTPLLPQTSHLSCLHEKAHCHLTPSTKNLHRLISQSSPRSPHVHTDKGIQASCRNILENLDWILKYGDPTMNANTSRLIRKAEQLMQLSRNVVMRDVLRHHQLPPSGSISFSAIKTKKKKQYQG